MKLNADLPHELITDIKELCISCAKEIDRLGHEYSINQYMLGKLFIITFSTILESAEDAKADEEANDE